MFLPQEIIRKSRDRIPLTATEIEAFIAGVVDGAVTDAQIAAFAMAVLLRGLSPDERVALTLAMARSGRTMDWAAAGLPGPVLDKHSTGGIGDKTSLAIAPLVAACGGFVPMVSGRGLGHTGGTLDKLESIPGYAVRPDAATFAAVVKSVGCAIIGATDDLAPADRRIYAVRDTTATVESLDLITASILSKKLAAGLDGLVMDVKVGSGAFLPSHEAALALARSIADVGGGAGLPVVALVTDMDRVLGRAAGNALEVREALDLLTGRALDARLWAVTEALSAELLVLGGLAPDMGAARLKLRRALDDGSAAERFGRMAAALGGPADLVERYEALLPTAPVVVPVPPSRAGHVGPMDVRAIGVAILALGGGRTRPEDSIDPTVGLTDMAGTGEAVGPDRPLALVHARDAAAAEVAAAAIRAAVSIVDEAVAPGDPIVGRIAGRASA
jgi:thymidine phosphorylase